MKRLYRIFEDQPGGDEEWATTKAEAKRRAGVMSRKPSSHTVKIERFEIVDAHNGFDLGEVVLAANGGLLDYLTEAGYLPEAVS